MTIEKYKCKSAENVILVGKEKNNLKELSGLTRTAGGTVVDILLHRGENINPAIYIGKGKLRELKNIINSKKVDTVIFDNELSPAQFSNIEEKLDRKVVDRTQLILDIFAQHAHTRESKIQVELAQLQYMLPNLTGQGRDLSRLAGGIGTRGPGETKLEIDRRRIKERISKIKNELNNIKKNRQVQRAGRTDPVIALVGYTNVGKSSLLNLLTGANTQVANKLFATLDSKLRRTVLPCGCKVIITDTVGFIKRLPHQLVSSFRSTIEVVKESDIIIHVMDASKNEIKQYYQAINSVLDDIDVLEKKTINVLNKIDLIEENKKTELELTFPDAISVSTKTKEGKDLLVKSIEKIILDKMFAVTLQIPYKQASTLKLIHKHGAVFKEKYKNDHIVIKARLTKQIANKLKKYTVVT